ncbi:MAG: hypothetical protein MZV70_13670 [Desulfobacterales bacterium]|nr:hypothetical protein [Desulfobacterales bacterium]
MSPATDVVGEGGAPAGRQRDRYHAGNAVPPSLCRRWGPARGVRDQSRGRHADPFRVDLRGVIDGEGGSATVSTAVATFTLLGPDGRVVRGFSRPEPAGLPL